MLSPKLSNCIMPAKGLRLKTTADFDPNNHGSDVARLALVRPARDAKCGRPCSLEAVQRSTTAAEATARAAERAAGPQDAGPSFGTEQQHVRGGCYSEAAQEEWLRRWRSLLLNKYPGSHVDDTHTVQRELFGGKRM